MNLNRYKIAIVCITLNPMYWPYLGLMIESARKFLLKGHDVDFICWSDIPFDDEEKMKGLPQEILISWQKMNVNFTNPAIGQSLNENIQKLLALKGNIKIIPTEPFEWPLPTLMRYSLFLREEELLKDYDFIFYCDADMEFVSRVGDEILGDLVACQHPMYALRRNYIPPYEPNVKSTSYIPRPGRVIEIDGKKKFEPLYAAGGFQGGRTDKFIEAMKVMKKQIDEDFNKNNYIPIWNDETAWNKYLMDNPPTVILSPSYIYPDSLNKMYYQKLWGRNYLPKIITLTKPFSLTKEGGLNLQQVLQT